MHPHDEQENVPHAAWPRDFDVRAIRAEQQELLAPPPNHQQATSNKQQAEQGEAP